MFRGGIKQNQTYNRQPSWFHLNRSKHSVTLDLKRERDKAILKDLVKISDVFIENSRTGVMERFGFGYQDLTKIKPDIIMVSMAAFGNTGPYATYPAYGAALEALSGIQNLTAYEKDGKPQRIREVDVINGVGAACAVMTGLMDRQRTGQGQHVDFSQMELPTHALIGEHLLEYAMNGTHAPALGNRHRQFAPQGCYPCKGDDKWVTLTIRTEQEWQRFCDALGHPEWKQDSRFASSSNRIKNHDELDRLIEKWTTRYTHYEAMHILQSHDIPSGAVLDVAEISDDPHLKERGYFAGEVRGSDKPFMGMPFKLAGGTGRVRWRGPDLGQQNEYVLCEILKRSKDEVQPVRDDEIGFAYDS
jgi:crotonobetainyl-CoA:carnitine CoA-transferase CaiB-like acyl-CoA transferase